MRKRRFHSNLWPFGVGEPLDMGTFRGALAALLISCFSLYCLWHTRDLYAWWDRWWGNESTIDLAAQRWARLWAVIIGGSGIVASIVAMIMIPINRRRNQK